MDEAVERLAATVRDAAATGTTLSIRGGGSKDFLGHAADAERLDTTAIRGIVAYEPSELVVTVRSGTPLVELEAALAAEGQMLAFEPPRLTPDSTIGGSLAAGLSGPARPYRGAARDFILGCRVLDGRGRQLAFGGQVMKNVAGYDVSRLLTGSMGCLAVFLEVSLKVLPRPAADLSLALELSEEQAIRQMCRLGSRPLPLSGAAWSDGVLQLRLSGAQAAVAAARSAIGGEPVESSYWDALRDQRLEPFTSSLPMWRLSVPAATPPLDLPGRQLIDWGGAQRWIATGEPPEVVRGAAERAGGHATRYRGGDPQCPAFHPLPAALLALHRRIKAALDPAGVFNPGRLYGSL